MESVSPPGMRWLAGGTFRMGADRAYPEEAPVHKVTIGGFRIDEYAVTNRDFAVFVAATGYRNNFNYSGSDGNLRFIVHMRDRSSPGLSFS
jgi:formylglycine-generating enzyme required for sulfatase activity